jgi:uncharacterized protein YkuJ
MNELTRSFDFSGVSVSSFSYFSDSQFTHCSDKPFVISPPCVMPHPDGSVSHFVWESSIYPDRDTSEKLLEYFEKDGRVFVRESIYTKQSDIVL